MGAPLVIAPLPADSAHRLLPMCASVVPISRKAEIGCTPVAARIYSPISGKPEIWCVKRGDHNVAPTAGRLEH
jgi:hypothetical protein